MLKKIVTKTVIASLAALITIPNIANAYNVTEQMMGTGIGPVLSAVNQGKYTQIQDDWGNTHLVNSNQWQEYQLLLQQGSPKVKNVWVGWNEDSFYAIAAYQLEGQQKVELPKDKYIKVSDPYNCDQLSVLKYLGNTLGSQYLFNEEKAYNDMVKQVQKNNARVAAEAAKQQAENQRSAEESELNNKINAEMNTKSENKQGQKTALPYPRDYINNYRFTELNKSNVKILDSFDNERNYVQQWLDKNNLTLKQLKDMNFTTVNLEENSKKYGKQMYQAKVYFKWIEDGTLPNNCSTSDWIRYMLKRDAMSGWNWLALWDEGKCDVCLISQNLGDNKGVFKGWTSLDDAHRINNEIYKMIEANLPTIAGYTHITKEQKISQVDSLITLFVDPYTPAYPKTRFPNYVGRTEFMKRLKNKFGIEYLPNIQGDLDISGLTEQQIEDYKLK